ncbi:hypothetical protein HK101_011921 [Irineochytrium annulatum]|nr:hypothetical protein HK101_011921 [Irineochytrium annulatum]
MPVPTSTPASNAETAEDRAAGMRAGIRRMIIINLLLPPLFYYASRFSGVAVIPAMLISGIPPFLEALWIMWDKRSVDWMSLVVVGSVGLGVTVTVLTSDARILFIKDSFLTALLGLLFLGSVCCGRENLIWTYNRQWSPAEAQEELTLRYKRPGVKKSTTVMCFVWGCGLLLEAVARVALVFLIPIEAMVYVSPTLVIACFSALSLWNVLYIKHVRAKYARLQQDEAEEGRSLLEGRARGG